MNHNLSLRYSQLDSGIGASSDPYWLTMEQALKDDRITQAEAAQLVDALYDIDPCVDTTTEPSSTATEEPTQAKLIDVVSGLFDIEECNRRKSGTYITDLKVIRSHPDVPYVLRLSVGTITQTVIVSEEVTVTIDVKGESFVILLYPVKSGLIATWLGPVVGESGSVTHPIITAKHNTLSWPGSFTGTIQATFQTVYDLVTIEVPGIPNYDGSPLGEPQDSSVLAFYHGQVFQKTISPPPLDTGADAATLAQVCGWDDAEELDQPEDPEPLPEPPAMPEYGCIETSLRFADPNYYAEKCCEAKPPNPCAVRKEPNPGGKTLSQETIDRLTREHNGPIEFIAVGPEGVDGCGAVYTEQVVRQKSCCDEATPIVWDDESSVEILADYSRGVVSVTGGIAPYTWKVRGQGMGFNEAGTLKTITTAGPSVTVIAAEACGSCPITVTDGCSISSGAVRSTNGQWVQTNEDFGCVGGSITDIGGFANQRTWISINGGRKQQQYTNYPFAKNVVPATKLRILACDAATTPQDEMMIECIAWAKTVQECPDETPRQYCHDAQIPQTTSDLYQSGGFCPWGILGFDGCQNPYMRCVVSDTYYRWEC